MSDAQDPVSAPVDTSENAGRRWIVAPGDSEPYWADPWDHDLLEVVEGFRRGAPWAVDAMAALVALVEAARVEDRSQQVGE